MKPMLVIEPDAGAPPYEQLKQQLSAAIQSGQLQPETKLPTVRRLAADLGVAPNTVARTDKELERANLIETRGRSGTVVRPPVTEDQVLRQAADEYAATVRRMEADPAAALALVEAAIVGGATEGDGSTPPSSRR